MDFELNRFVHCVDFTETIRDFVSSSSSLQLIALATKYQPQTIRLDLCASSVYTQRTHGSCDCSSAAVQRQQSRSAYNYQHSIEVWNCRFPRSNSCGISLVCCTTFLMDFSARIHVLASFNNLSRDETAAACSLRETGRYHRTFMSRARARRTKNIYFRSMPSIVRNAFAFALRQCVNERNYFTGDSARSPSLSHFLLKFERNEDDK